MKADLLSDTTTVSIPIKFSGAKIWNLDHPNLYTCEVELKQGKNMIDNTDRTFGFRSFILDGIGKDAMPRLNGNRMMLRTAIIGDSSQKQDWYLSKKRLKSKSRLPRAWD